MPQELQLRAQLWTDQQGGLHAVAQNWALHWVLPRARRHYALRRWQAV